MKHKITINNINDAFVEDDFIFFCSGCKVVKYSLTSNQQVMEFVAHFIISYLHYWRNCLILKDNLNNSIFLEKSTLEQLQNPIEKYKLADIQNEFAFIYQKEPIREYGVFSLLENRILIMSETFHGKNKIDDFFYGIYCTGPLNNQTRLQIKNCNFRHGKEKMEQRRQARHSQGSL